MIKERNVGIDVLRILLALAVIAIHFNAPATGHVALSVTGNMKFLVFPMVAICYPAVNTYVLISGFFGYKNKKKIESIMRSLLNLWLCLIFFSMLGYSISILTGQTSFNLFIFFKHLFPLSRGVWWFMTVYFVMMLISPALNLILDNFTKKDFVLSMIWILIICSIIPFFLNYESRLCLNKGYGLIWFIILYLTGGGISKFFMHSKNKKYIYYSALSFILFSIFPFAALYIIKILGINGDYTFLMYNSISVYGQAISLLVLFFNIDIKNTSVSKIISFVAGISLASYVFHCQEDISKIIWRITEPYKYADSLYLILLFIYTVFGVYLLAVAIEFFRKKLFSMGNIQDKIIAHLLHLVANVNSKLTILFERKNIL